ncbi:hypothetical protein [Jeotgalibacillus campisalis]|uniref:Uncharacterized protein n=1 Tax=Jeotgalibacillus campisalis TaxID=220754 RepID=A0A0C2VQ92_9BACL|nr:hypothetical protein [Jeotgalibacillus campisalis]KIL46183.1 hypothetical protein KR50_28580 [Jeotgalibacillus campisalis]
MSIEANKCNVPKCKGFVVFENADFDFNNLQVGKSNSYEFDDPKCTECGKQYYVVPHYVVVGDPDDEPLESACMTAFMKRENYRSFEEEQDPYEKIQKYIRLMGYTYSPNEVVKRYSDYKEGSYVSFTMKDCIKNLKPELEKLI